MPGPFSVDSGLVNEFLPIVNGEETILEQDGIHFINSGLFDDSRHVTEDNLDDDFKDLVESVMGKQKGLLNLISSKYGD
jgi:hypothetical protein